MTDLHQDLLTQLSGSICWMGLGNESLGDDGFGMKLARTMRERGHPQVMLAGTTPERYLTETVQSGCDHLVFLDAVDFGATPGDVLFLGSPEIRARFPQISTHKISTGLLAQWIETSGKMKVWLLGVQPQCLRTVGYLSEILETTRILLAGLLQEILLPGIRAASVARTGAESLTREDRTVRRLENLRYGRLESLRYDSTGATATSL